MNNNNTDTLSVFHQFICAEEGLDIWFSACNIQCHYHTASATHPKNNTLVYLNHPPTHCSGLFVMCAQCSGFCRRRKPWLSSTLKRALYQMRESGASHELMLPYFSQSDSQRLLQYSPSLLPCLVCHQSSPQFVPFLRRAWVSTTSGYCSTPACLFQVGFVFSSLWWLSWT